MNERQAGRWEVRICGHTNELENLKSTFSDGWFFIVFDSAYGEYLLCSDSFEVFADAAEVVEQANIIARRLITATELASGTRLHLSVNNATRRVPDGWRQVFHFATEALTPRLTEHAQVVAFEDGKEIGPVARPAPRDTRAEILELAETDDVASDILDAWYENSDNWPGLYIIHEKVGDAVGGKRNISRVLFNGDNVPTRLFGNSAQAYRHGSNRGHTHPSDLMGFDDARNYVLSAVRALIQHRLKKDGEKP